MQFWAPIGNEISLAFRRPEAMANSDAKRGETQFAADCPLTCLKTSPILSFRFL